MEKSGGFAGLIKKAEIDTKNLSEAEIYRIKRMLNECNINSIKNKVKKRNIPKGSADYDVYKVSVIDAGKKVQIECNEYTIDHSLKILVNYLLKVSPKS